ncbi:MAG: DoxX family protein [Chitinophagales bacterium]|nr:DoxX family protein [Chitinophagales bacterium]
MMSLMKAQPFYQSGGLMAIRCILGVLLIYHGTEVFDQSIINKYLSWDVFKISAGKTLVYTGKILELVAGIFFLLGFCTRIASLCTIGVMGFIAFFIGKGKIWYEDQHPFLFILLALVFFFTGPGSLSIDALLFKKKRVQ